MKLGVGSQEVRKPFCMLIQFVMSNVFRTVETYVMTVESRDVINI